LFLAHIILRCMPLSSLITPATLSVTLKPNTTLHAIPVNQPIISTFDYKDNELDISYLGSRVRLSRMFNILADTGELLWLSAPENLQNISYTVNLIIPLVRCRVSNESVRSWIATAAYKEATSRYKAFPAIKSHRVANNSGSYIESLTFTVNGTNPLDEHYEMTWKEQIGYYAMPSNTSMVDEVWIAISTRNDTPVGISGSYSAIYYTCALRNASVTTKVAFVNNAPSLQASAIEEVELNNPKRIFDGYSPSLFAPFFGSVSNVELKTYDSNGYSAKGRPEWNTTLERTVFGSSKDFFKMAGQMANYLPGWVIEGGYWSNAKVQEKNLAELIEEFSLNASWSLMAIPEFK
jgi:hypothetical protein